MEALRLMDRPPQPEEHGQDCGGRRPRQRRAPPSTRKRLPILTLNARADLAWFVPRQGPFYGLATTGRSGIPACLLPWPAFHEIYPAVGRKLLSTPSREPKFDPDEPDRLDSNEAPRMVLF
jgi:hypothetical protein